MTQVQSDFIEKISQVNKNCIGNETAGNFVEFYDEDGVILMSCEKENNKLIFTFQDGSVYEYADKDLAS